MTRSDQPEDVNRPDDGSDDHADSHSRRRFLKGGLAAAGAAAGLSATGCRDRGRTGDPATAFHAASIHQRQPLYGRHQAGIITPIPAAATVAAFDVVGSDRARLVQLFRRLSERIAWLMVGGPVPTRDPRLPPLDSGLLGPDVFPDNLAVTVSVGASLFDRRFGLAPLRPRQLVEMPSFGNDALDAAWCDGDLLLQLCSNTAETNQHALRDLIKHGSGLMNLRWTLDGFLPPHTVQRPGKDSIINLLGFKDGTANPDADDEALMNRLIWVQTGQGEPAWATDGSYQAVRIIRNFVEFWDRTPLREQERIMGRHRATGAPLGKHAEHDPVGYDDDPDGALTPLDAHIRLANPRTPGTRQILRRSYNYARGMTRAGQLDQGLLFMCFQNDLDDGFIAIQKRLEGEPLEEYIKPVGGGFYFALPGMTDPHSYLGQALFEAVG